MSGRRLVDTLAAHAAANLPVASFDTGLKKQPDVPTGLG